MRLGKSGTPPVRTLPARGGGCALEAVVPDPLSCIACGHRTPVELQMTAKNKQVLTMVSCPKCETRSWYADGSPVSKDEVLKITANDPEFVVMPSTGGQRSRR
jgi:hypothetical protein